jgi:hypothetical protein
MRLAVPVLAVVVLLVTAGPAGAHSAGPGLPGLFPDLRSAVPGHFTIQNDHQHEYLRFSNLIANTGMGGLRIRPEHDPVSGITTGYQEVFDQFGTMVENKPVSDFVFHPAHNHWHITAVALFEIRAARDDGTTGRIGDVVGGQTIKTTFCLIDVVRLEGNSNTPNRTYWDCFPDQHQGISAGWGDQYHQATEGQELELTGQPPGVYYLVTTSNPESAFLETDYTNNTAWASFRLRRDSKGNPKVTAISHSPCAGTLCGSTPNR